jgi:hypothetical protein
MKTLIKIFFLFFTIQLFIHCNLKKKVEQVTENANQRFGDQHFKTAIALIELYKVRFGKYPESLDSIKYMGDWDLIIKTSVKYQKLDTGYRLDLTKGWIGKPQNLSYPDEFCKGLGLIKSNVKK